MEEYQTKGIKYSIKQALKNPKYKGDDNPDSGGLQNFKTRPEKNVPTPCDN